VKRLFKNEKLNELILPNMEVGRKVLEDHIVIPDLIRDPIIMIIYISLIYYWALDESTIIGSAYRVYIRLTNNAKQLNNDVNFNVCSLFNSLWPNNHSLTFTKNIEQAIVYQSGQISTIQTNK
jgi:hypothetical protein